MAPSRAAELDDFVHRRYAGLYRDHAFLTPADEADLLRKLLDAPELRGALDLLGGSTS